MRARAPLVWILLAASHAYAGQLRAGASAVRITPPKGIALYGYYHNRAASGVHDDLYAKAIVLEADGVRAALVSCDLGELPRPMVEEARALIAQRTGIPGERVMIGATHTHTGPVLLEDGSWYNLAGEMLEITKRYSSGLPSLIAASVTQAAEALAPAKLSVGLGREESLVFNRRFFMKDGTVGWNPGKLNPKILKPAGPVDPAVSVVYLERPDGRPLATYVNYALHLDTVGGDEFSADYPYTLADILGKVKGPGMVTMFTQGCSGNVNHLDVNSAAPQHGHGEAARIGTVLAGEVLKTYTRLKPAAGGPIRVRSEIVKLPLTGIDRGELGPARAMAAKFGEPGAVPFLKLVHAVKVLEVAGFEGKPVEAEVQVITLGNQLAFVALPGEVFVELGQAIKASSPFPMTVVVELANGSIGYVPNRKAYAEGNYEVVSARVAEGSGEMLVEAALRMLREAREVER